MPDKEPRKPDEEITVVEDGMYDSPDVSDESSNEDGKDVKKAEETSRSESGEKRSSEKKEKADKGKTAVMPGSGFGKFIRGISIKGWLLIIVLLMILICAMLFFFHRNFRVQEIHVVGNNRFTQEEILAISGVKEGDHLYSHVGGSLKEIARLQYGKARQKIISYDPYIADAKVYPHYPGEVYIEVTERRKVAYVAMPDGYAIISEDSVVLEIVTGDVPQGIPEIRGLPIRSAQIGKKLDLTSSDGYDICITVLGAILGSDANAQQDGDEFNFLSHVICVRYCENMTTFIDLDIPGVDHIISVKIGSLQTISDQMTWLRYAVVSGYFADKPGTVLDMTGSKYILR
ncbi:MAG: FtsQ-type POTRA domain-containing protein [Clostridiales bacterium]|nr:FtsQ-type POTRA domain-containing protein [Clostridiales bacterium]